MEEAKVIKTDYNDIVEQVASGKMVALIGDDVLIFNRQSFDSGKIKIQNAEVDALLEELWSQLADVPMNPETECLEEDFCIWKAGTEKEEIWHWFDRNYYKGVAELVGR